MRTKMRTLIDVISNPKATYASYATYVVQSTSKEERRADGERRKRYSLIASVHASRLHWGIVIL